MFFACRSGRSHYWVSAYATVASLGSMPMRMASAVNPHSP